MQIPECIGKYDVQGVLGKGATGLVFRGFDPGIKRPVALKVITKSLLDAADLDYVISRFRHESEAVGRLTHPRIAAAPDEFPAHQVTLDAYWMYDQLEVTNAMYQLCVGAGACTLPQNLGTARKADYFNNPEFKDYPVIYVTWGQAKTYCEWTGRRLPTEAEWERAARGDDMRTFPWGEDKADHRFANFNMLVTDTSRVGSYPLGASPFGVLDMAGNVAEWTNDIYSPTFYASALEMLNPTGPVSSSSLKRVVRGGSLGDA